MGAKVRETPGLRLMVTNHAEKASQGARDAMRRGMDNIGKLAVKFAPVDEGNLENAIRYPGNDERATDYNGVNRRARFFVFVDLTMPAGNGKLVGDYAGPIHDPERHPKIFPAGTYRLGPNSLAKDAGSGRVGPKFLDRAWAELLPSVLETIQRRMSVGVGK